MFKKYVLIFLIAGMAAFSLGCSGEDDPNDENANQLTNKIINAVKAASNEVYESHEKGLATKAISSGTGWSADYTYSGSDPITITIDFVWGGYEYDGVTLSSGETHTVFIIHSDGSWTITNTGNFNVSYRGVNYNYSWDIEGNYNASTGTYTFTGTYTIDDTDYTYSFSGY